MRKIILICGKAGAGKNTLADLLTLNLKYNSYHYAFADSLKRIARSMMWDGKKDSKGRRFLQHLGAVGREYNEDIWANITAEDIDENKKVDVHIVTDFRFPNEYEVLRNKFGEEFVVTVKIDGRSLDLGDNADDISEHALDNFKADYHISNVSTMEELDNSVVSLIKTMNI